MTEKDIQIKSRGLNLWYGDAPALKDVTIAIVTHNMRQAARVFGHTAFFLLRGTIELGKMKQIFNPEKKSAEDYITGMFG
uniref:Phosphate ABC transporter ATP-binding protein n=1 Tax=Candidatus Methanogaster sp. ANME-2c ERB4 TaxID=2759911 RepID=A0A7G9Y9B7_9EURY|nr:hypothetical protein PPMBPIKO_00003 [Methanosarcinales archaeon ANME-2c ERB4]QNO43897.1 hypothetical protein EHKOOOLC_00002 [Methanosarcinales archaeon ANME-2c ERB4]QNO44495.1 hypothetical protein ELEJOALA_00042 [Methanosarcinales archaeon ANME-2c ERB4]QNO44601.1 hypothetical protein JBICLBBK_00004 [Methanosarcinales archaeon ANME-2c ERB4]QNO45227.1 hypothetical protein KDMJNAGO_00042 [Methanosarcinales archaeon ANME-2c ERB4]